MMCYTSRVYPTLFGSDNVIAFTKDVVYMYLAKSDEVLTIGKRHGNMYNIDLHYSGEELHRVNAVNRANIATFPIRQLTLMEWHIILGHAALKIIIATLKAAGIEFDFKGQSIDCCICLLVKFRFLTTKPTGTTVSPRFLYHISEDMFELACESYYRANYCAYIVDRYSGYPWVLWLRNKSDFGPAFVKFCKTLEIEHDALIVKIQGDGGELKCDEVTDFCENHSPNKIKLINTPSHTQSENGGVERPLGVDRARAQCMLASANLPQKLFNFAMDYALVISRALVHNRPSNKDSTGAFRCSQYIALGHLPDYTRLIPFGCLVAVGVTKKIRTTVFKQLSDRNIVSGSRLWKAEPGLFLGYTSKRIALIYLYRTQRVHEVFHFRPLSRVFPGLSLKPHHINPALISDNFLGPLGREPEITGEEEDDVPISNTQGEGISDSFNDKQRLLIGSNIGSNSDRTFTDTGIRAWN